MTLDAICNPPYAKVVANPNERSIFHEFKILHWFPQGTFLGGAFLHQVGCWLFGMFLFCPPRKEKDSPGLDEHLFMIPQVS